MSAGDAGSEAAALGTAARGGITLDALTRDQIGHWITEAETERCDAHEQLLRLLVRSARIDAATLVWPSTCDEAVGLLTEGGQPRATLRELAGVPAVAHLGAECAGAGSTTLSRPTFSCESGEFC
ncbi:hypothetical protein ABZ835_44790 [Streptomyces sp. NPDC047461]|uniref:hypothetical protein n=1 Tax=Streptomyces sp. NPDC047461 TaxID=3155619 RepID=UPI0033EF677E